jgi:Fe-S-cluster containining protein
VPVTEDDMRREPRLAEVERRLLALDVIEVEPGKHWIGYEEHPCPLLTETGLCSINDTKPHVCAVFPPGTYHCQWARGRSGLRPLYPIVGKPLPGDEAPDRLWEITRRQEAALAGEDVRAWEGLLR